MTDDAYERLAQRNAELEQEKAALAGEVESLNEHIEVLQEKQVAETCACSHDYPADVCLGHSPMLRKVREELEHTRGERGAAIKRAQVAEDERDALSSYVEQLHAKIDECYGDPARMHLEVGDIRDRGPTTSLARRDAEQQKIGAASFKAELHEASTTPVRIHAEGVFAVWLRRQAEAAKAGEGE